MASTPDKREHLYKILVIGEFAFNFNHFDKI